MCALPLWTKSAGMALVICAPLFLGACPEREPIPNIGSAVDAAVDARVQDSPGPPAKIILLIGDGMGRGHIQSASYVATGTPEGLNMHSLPMQGTVTTSSPSGITDSAASATAMASGHFTFNGRVGIDLDGLPVQNLVELAKSYGLATGIVTTTRLSHATPACFTAHVNSRGQYQDIALQMAQLRPNVMLGGGLTDFVTRADGLNLVNELRELDYQVVSTANELQAVSADHERPLLGLFADGHLPYFIGREANPEDATPTLSAMALAALARLDKDPEGFFLMIEGGRIDHASHSNLVNEAVGETLAFDRMIGEVVKWAGERDDVTILVTADHETGGLHVNGPTPTGAPPNVSWRWGNHTNTTVQCFGQGPGTERFDGATRDHRWVHAVLGGLIRGESSTPEIAVLPNGFLGDLVGPTVSQQQENPEDAATRLTRLTLSASKRGIGIGLEGLYRWDQGAVVLLIDVDYGMGTGPRSLIGIDDNNSGANTFLSRIQLPVPSDNNFGTDMVFISQHGLSTVYSASSVGLRGLRPPYGAPDDLQSILAASNFSDNARSFGETSTVESSRGLELFIRWQELYPGRTTAPPDGAVAVWAVQVNEDGGATNQSLPPWLNDDATLAPPPLTMRFSESALTE